MNGVINIKPFALDQKTRIANKACERLLPLLKTNVYVRLLHDGDGNETAVVSIDDVVFIEIGYTVTSPTIGGKVRHPGYRVYTHVPDGEGYDERDLSAPANVTEAVADAVRFYVASTIFGEGDYEYMFGPSKPDVDEEEL